MGGWQPCCFVLHAWTFVRPAKAGRTLDRDRAEWPGLPVASSALDRHVVYDRLHPAGILGKLGDERLLGVRACNTGDADNGIFSGDLGRKSSRRTVAPLKMPLSAS